MRYVLVTHEPPTVSVLHLEHPFEECNTDDARKKEFVDEATAEALLATSIARTCEWCEPVIDPPNLETRGKAP